MCEPAGLEYGGELRSLEGVPCDTCLVADPLEVWAVVETACGSRVMFQTATTCLVGAVSWTHGADSDQWSQGYCGDAFTEWTVEASVPLEVRVGALEEMMGVLPAGAYEFEVHFSNLQTGAFEVTLE